MGQHAFLCRLHSSLHDALMTHGVLYDDGSLDDEALQHPLFFKRVKQQLVFEIKRLQDVSLQDMMTQTSIRLSLIPVNQSFLNSTVENLTSHPVQHLLKNAAINLVLESFHLLCQDSRCHHLQTIDLILNSRNTSLLSPLTPREYHSSTRKYEFFVESQ